VGFQGVRRRQIKKTHRMFGASFFIDKSAFSASIEKSWTS
jgi:hypothetical protein